jgi:ribosomal RNA-processing protein 12
MAMQLHKTVGAAIAAMGPEKFLRLLPLQLDTDDFSNGRIWLLPILRQNVVGSELKYFSDKIVPLIQSLGEKIKKVFVMFLPRLGLFTLFRCLIGYLLYCPQFSAEGKPTTAKKAEALVHSLWALFPAFCNYPSDTQKAFGLVAKSLGGVLSEEPELRGVICRGLQVEIYSCVLCPFGISRWTISLYILLDDGYVECFNISFLVLHRCS